MNNKTLEKIKLRNKGVEVLPSCYTPHGVIFSFSLPPKTMKKFKKLCLIFNSRNVLFQTMLESFKFKKCKLNNSLYSSEFEEYLEKNKIELTKKLKHKDYVFNSAVIKTEYYEAIKEIALYYRITRSSLVRVMIDAYEEFV